MDQFDPAIQIPAVSGIKPLLPLLLFASLGSFFLGAFVTTIKRGIKEEGWFDVSKNKEK